MTDTETGLTVAVTGPTGTFGSGLVPLLLDDDRVGRVVGIARRPFDPAARGWAMEYRRGDVRDPAVWQRALQGMEVVYHLAAEVGVGQSMYEIVRYMDVNTMGTAQLLELLAHGRHKVDKLIVASSMSIYGEGAYRAPDGRIVTTVRTQQGPFDVAADFVIDCTGLEADIAEHRVLQDLLEHSGAGRNPKGRLDVERTFELLADVPAGWPVISESIATIDQVARLQRAGVDALLLDEGHVDTGLAHALAVYAGLSLDA